MNSRQSIASGGPIERFRDGWALIGLGSEVAHYWNQDTSSNRPGIGKRGRPRFWRALCGVLAVSNEQVPPLHRGGFPKCRRCNR